MRTDPQMESRMTASGGGLRGGGTEKKERRTHGHGQVW